MKFLAGLKEAFIPHSGNGHHPHVLRHGIVWSLLAAVLIVQFAATIQIFVLSRGSGFLAAVLPTVLVELTNSKRTAENLGVLTPNTVLEAAAQAKANDMAAKGYFAHVSPEGLTPWVWFEEAGYAYQNAGENLAVNFADSGDVVNAWMASPSHRANIEKADYTEIGIATAVGTYKGREAIFVVQLFGTPLVKTVAVAPVPSPKPALDTAPISVPAGSVQGVEVVNPPPAASPTAKPTPKVAQADGLPLRNQDQIEPMNDPLNFSDEPVVSSPVVDTSTLAPAPQTNTETVSNAKRIAYETRSISKTALKIVLGFFVLALAIALFFKFRVVHEQAVVNGILAVAVVGMLLFMNIRFFPSAPDLPDSSEGAAISLSQ